MSTQYENDKLQRTGSIVHSLMTNIKYIGHVSTQ